MATYAEIWTLATSALNASGFEVSAAVRTFHSMRASALRSGDPEILNDWLMTQPHTLRLVLQGRHDRAPFPAPARYVCQLHAALALDGLPSVSGHESGISSRSLLRLATLRDLGAYSAGDALLIDLFDECVLLESGSPERWALAIAARPDWATLHLQLEGFVAASRFGSYERQIWTAALHAVQAELDAAGFVYVSTFRSTATPGELTTEGLTDSLLDCFVDELAARTVRATPRGLADTQPLPRFGAESEETAELREEESFEEREERLANTTGSEWSDDPGDFEIYRNEGFGEH